MIHPSKILGEANYSGLRMTAEEYLSIGETGARYELIDGVVVMPPSRSFRHGEVIRFLMEALGRCAGALPGLRFASDVDVHFGPALVYRPDIGVFSPGRIQGRADRLTVVPDLVIEVLSPGSRTIDLEQKRTDYARFGVGEYWVVDQDDLSVRVWRRTGAGLGEVAAAGDRLACSSIPGLVIDLIAVRDGLSSL